MVHEMGGHHGESGAVHIKTTAFGLKDGCYSVAS
ncbi:unnamed protein product [Fusarium graminearum]|uniref:Chromosome 1, complete genome n=1 Tax=Gibberella zeae (strain ATCC MYA-4620 / CBS 123657 / FGSC 9075 / NRRL 31084 / PH-1) TaxID=229533 RepID=A0A0E0RQ00_GIBZE|nr:hypothetical protein FG05_35399 [Fusarium graminearum]CEF73325.1 unnamed protein product [Fusarium graminearum]CZS76596.1 unnamed protein product [Fusarium graminearum]